MPYYRKRTYANAFGRKSSAARFKRSRYTRKRRANYRGGKRTVDFTQQNQRSTAIGFRGRKISRRAYRSHLWNSTIFKDHYRSIQTLHSTDTTPATFGTTAGIIFFNMYRNAGNQFWITAGGAQPIDLAIPLPIFEGGVTLRGGVYNMTISNKSADDIKIKIWTFTTGNNPDTTIIPQVVDAAWDPTVTPDWSSELGRAKGGRQVIVEGGGAYTWSTRFRMQKIDEIAYDEDARAPHILITYANINSNNATVVGFTTQYNLSFSGDAVTPGQ